jgi:hypothetical protein
MLHTMMWSKLKFVLAVLLTLGLLGAGTGGLLQQSATKPAASPGKARGAEQQPPVAAGAAVATTKTSSPAEANPVPPDSTISEEARVLFAARRLHEKLNKPVTLDMGIDKNTPVKDALEFLSDRYDLTIMINESAFKADGISDNAAATPVGLPRMSNVTLNTILQLLAEQVKGSFLITPDGIVFTTPQRTRPEDWLTDRSLPPLVTVRFARRGLRAALEDLSQMTGVSVVLDRRVHGEPRLNTALNNVPLDTAVRLLADMSDLDVVAMDSILYVTDKPNAEKLQREQEARRQKIQEKPKKAPPQQKDGKLKK